ncbi:FbpB family small basic protein [Cytobacillus spongiae]|jgi:hypothetical protein|nr:FbpB family small basic protein [Cytobacillus spongiae]UII57879.1 FbpB family small basic protein [Cytobacillus spongiae]
MKKKNFLELIEENKKDIAEDLAKLEEIYEKIEQHILSETMTINQS